jgi:hypothetical protein
VTAAVVDAVLEAFPAGGRGPKDYASLVAYAGGDRERVGRLARNVALVHAGPKPLENPGRYLLASARSSTWALDERASSSWAVVVRVLRASGEIPAPFAGPLASVSSWDPDARPSRPPVVSLEEQLGDAKVQEITVEARRRILARLESRPLPVVVRELAAKALAEQESAT